MHVVWTLYITVMDFCFKTLKEVVALSLLIHMLFLTLVADKPLCLAPDIRDCVVLTYTVHHSRHRVFHARTLYKYVVLRTRLPCFSRLYVVYDNFGGLQYHNMSLLASINDKIIVYLTV